MSAEKPDLARAGTMQVTAKEGKAYLDKNLTEWKKPYLMDGEDGEEDEGSDQEEVETSSSPVKKPKMSKHSTMKGTAKEGKALVGDKLGDTRAETKSKTKGKSSMGRSSTIDKVTAEAKLIYGDLPKSEGRSLRKRSAPAPAKAPLKKKGTMVRTAKEGKEYLKRGRPKKAAPAEKADEAEDSKSE